MISEAAILEFIDRHPDVNVLESEYKRLLGLPPEYELGGRTRELADWARQWFLEHGKPWLYARQVEKFDCSNGELRIENTTLSSKRLLKQFTDAKAESGVLVAVSAGKECEEKAKGLWNEEKPDEYFFLEVYGSAVVEHLVARAAFRLCEWADTHQAAVLPHYSPGYPGWNIADQPVLLKMMGSGGNNAFPGGISVLETGMLDPKKSLLAVFGLTTHLENVRRANDLIPCENCSLSPCQYRRAPYRTVLPQLEDVRRLQKQAVTSATRESEASPRFKYSVGLPALKKWSAERLQVTAVDAYTVEARFLYQGTTCSNMGRPLEFEYTVHLARNGSGYVIKDARCEPAKGDTGHRFMCQYLEGPERLLKEIGSEAPLKGKPLESVFEWNRSYNPSGCYCDAGSRAHKWGLVLEVLHYAQNNGAFIAVKEKQKS